VEMESYYDLLGISPEASAEEIKLAYKKVVSKVHPDAGGTDGLFRAVKQAYDTLSDPKARAEYDRFLREGRQPPSYSSEEARKGTTGWGEAWQEEYGYSSEDHVGRKGASGWVRADEPFEDLRQSGASSESQANRGSRFASYGFIFSSRAHQSGTPSVSTNYEVRSFASRHPAATLMLAGLIMMMLPSLVPLASFNFVMQFWGFILLCLGTVAVIGGHRLAPRSVRRYVPIPDIDAMSGYQFEVFLASLFRAKGYFVKQTGKTGDFGADLVIERGKIRAVVQAKRWSGSVGSEAIQQVVAAMAPYRANSAIVITNSTFTSHAQALAKANDVILWDRRALISEIRRSGMLRPAAGPYELNGWSLLRYELREGFRSMFKFLVVAVIFWAGERDLRHLLRDWPRRH